MTTIDEFAKERFLTHYLDATVRRENAEMLWAALLRGDQLIYHRDGEHIAHYQLRAA